MQITQHFSKAELERSNTATRLGLPNICPPGLVPNMTKVVARLELVRLYYDAPITILSCYRSPAVNSAVGGSATSAHRFALAADFTVQGKSVKEVCKWCAKNLTDYDQIIYEFGENGWIHIGFCADKEPRLECLSAVKEGSKTVYKRGIK